jgi:hypothetical protein
MGEVYRARDTRLERSVAIKILPAHLSADPARTLFCGPQAIFHSSREVPRASASLGLENILEESGWSVFNRLHRYRYWSGQSGMMRAGSAQNWTTIWATGFGEIGLLAFGPVAVLGFDQVGLRESKVNCRQLLNDFQQCPFRNFIFENACSICGFTHAQSA